VSGKDRPLGNLINAMCHDNEVQRLLRLSFIGFEDVIENELVFKARNSDPLAFPNYHQVLYAYYMQRKNYKDGTSAFASPGAWRRCNTLTGYFSIPAGITMYQQGRRLGEHLHLGSDDFFAVAAFQAQCYLAAISAFSEVRPEHAWATLPVTNQSMLTTQVSTRTRLEVKCFTLIEAHTFRPENDASLHHMFLLTNSQSSTGTLRL
jgi:nuclear pore complex protein Nup160